MVVKVKLVAVSVWFRGRQLTVFTYGTVGEDGKTRVSPKVYNDLTNRLGVQHGETYSTG